MNQSVSRSLKAYCHQSVIKCYITSFDGGRLSTNIKILEAMTVVTGAWKFVLQETVSKNLV